MIEFCGLYRCNSIFAMWDVLVHAYMIPQCVHNFRPLTTMMMMVVLLLLFYIYCDTSKFHFQVKSNTITVRMFSRLSFFCFFFSTHNCMFIYSLILPPSYRTLLISILFTLQRYIVSIVRFCTENWSLCVSSKILARVKNDEQKGISCDMCLLLVDVKGKKADMNTTNKIHMYDVIMNDTTHEQMMTNMQHENKKTWT